MQPSRFRLICRSRNPFSPSIALWKHFRPAQPVVPSQKRLVSSAPASLEASSDHGAQSEPLLLAGASEALEAQAQNNPGDNEVAPNAQVIRKVVDSRARSSYTAYDDPRSIKFLRIKAQQAVQQATDYEGVVALPIRPARNVSDWQLPYIVPQEDWSEDAWHRLGVEMVNFHEHAKPSRMETLARTNAIERVKSEVRQTLPEHSLEIFGSERTGMALATSDIDLRLRYGDNVAHTKLEDSNLPPPRADRLRLLADLRKLYRKNLAKNESYTCTYLLHARYPLITLEDRATGLQFQIVLANDTSLSRSIMQKYMTEYPYLRRLYTVIKTMFDVRGLSDVFRGGFGSYSIFMMIVASLRHSPLPAKQQDAPSALVNFLKFWEEFDTTSKGISIEPTELFDKSTESVMPGTVKTRIKNQRVEPLPQFLLTLRDPADATNDLGRKGACIRHVQKTCWKLRRELLNDIHANNRKTLLGRIVGPAYAISLKRREKMEAEGKRIMKEIPDQLAAKAKALRQVGKEQDRAEVKSSSA